MGIFNKINEYLSNKKRQPKEDTSPNNFESLIKMKIVEIYIRKNGNQSLEDLNYETLYGNMELMKEAIKEINDVDYGKEKAKLLITIKNNRKEQIGFEKRHYERWQKTIDLYEMMIEFSIELGRKQKGRLGENNKYITGAKCVALLKIHSRSILIAREILVLLKAGYIDGAHARWRSMHELAAISLFLLDNETIVSERYLDHSYIRRALESKDFNAYSSKTGYPPYSKEELEDFEETRKKLVEKYGNDYDYTGGFGWIPTSITKNRNFRELEKLSGIDHLRPYYNWSTNQVHGGAHGFDYLGIPESERESIFFIGPSNHGVTDPIHSAALSLLQTSIAFLSSKKYVEFTKDIDLLGRFADEVGKKALEVTNEFEKEH